MFSVSAPLPQKALCPLLLRLTVGQAEVAGPGVSKCPGVPGVVHPINSQHKPRDFPSELNCFQQSAECYFDTVAARLRRFLSQPTVSVLPVTTWPIRKH